ncbi:hypothetical protein NL676_007987 [Syzygium grande]|nr:hypothetical protein NL676_007987 [Syzygium grande]
MQEFREGEEEPVAMSDPRNNRWKQEASGLEPREEASSFDTDDDRWRPNVERQVASSFFDADDQQTPGAPPVQRYSISAASLSQHELASKVRWLKDNVQLCSDDLALFSLPILSRFLLVAELERAQAGLLGVEMRGELREHSDAELNQVARYLGVLADETWKQGMDVATCCVSRREARIATLESEKKEVVLPLVEIRRSVFPFLTRVLPLSVRRMRAGRDFRKLLVLIVINFRDDVPVGWTNKR